jgi:hypothetical protein
MFYTASDQYAPFHTEVVNVGVPRLDLRARWPAPFESPATTSGGSAKIGRPLFVIADCGVSLDTTLLTYRVRISVLSMMTSISSVISS